MVKTVTTIYHLKILFPMKGFVELFLYQRKRAIAHISRIALQIFLKR